MGENTLFNVNTFLIVASSFATGLFLGRTFRSATKAVLGKNISKTNVNKKPKPSELDVISKLGNHHKLVLVLRQDLKLSKGKFLIISLNFFILS